MKSDIYSLGVLFFELFNPSADQERLRILAGLRHRILPLAVLQGRPQVPCFYFGRSIRAGPHLQHA